MLIIEKVLHADYSAAMLTTAIDMYMKLSHAYSFYVILSYMNLEGQYGRTRGSVAKLLFRELGGL